MKRIILIATSLVLISGSIMAWGFWGHQRINHMAVFCLPPEMVGYFKKNIDFVTEHAVDPDKRRYSDKEEAPRHYLDIDHYGKHPFDSMPERWSDAVKKYSEDTLKAYGIVPWHIQVVLGRLTDAFKNHEDDQILRLSADLGHYIADAHVPLHTTENYDGQMTGQKGIHAFWESRLPELYGEEYDYFVGRAEYIKNPLKETWKILRESNAALDSVLSMESDLKQTFPSDQQFTYEMRGKSNVKIYTTAYSEAYHRKLSGMVERRMRSAVHMVACFWYTAWVNAGQPDLGQALPAAALDSLRAQVRREELRLRQERSQGNIKGHEE